MNKIASSNSNSQYIGGRIELESFEFQCIIGILPFERTSPQNLIINLSYTYNFYPAIESEDISKAVSYVDVLDIVKNFCINRKFNLIESLVYHTAIELKKHFPKIEKIKLKASKPDILEGSTVCTAEVEL